MFKGGESQKLIKMIERTPVMFSRIPTDGKGSGDGDYDPEAEPKPTPRPSDKDPKK